jgi:2-iminobutanoate/2-iminopropanoate deaminase
LTRINIMAKTEIKHPDKAVSTGAYSAGIAMDGWLFVSGHAGQDLKTGNPVPGGVAEQTRAALTHVGKILAGAGAGFADVAKSTCHLAHIEDFDEFNAAYSEFFPPPLPARTTVQSGLPAGLLVEIDVIARAPR